MPQGQRTDNRQRPQFTADFSAPSDPKVNDLWFDGANNLLKYWNGSAWVNIAANGAVVAITSINGVTYRDPLSNAIADPGASGAIPVTVNGNVPLVTAAAETRTLAAPAFAGQELLLSFKTDAGDCVITCATAVNMAGNNTLTFSDAGEAILMVGVTVGANVRWRVVCNDGVELSTV